MKVRIIRNTQSAGENKSEGSIRNTIKRIKKRFESFGFEVDYFKNKYEMRDIELYLQARKKFEYVDDIPENFSATNVMYNTDLMPHLIIVSLEEDKCIKYQNDLYEDNLRYFVPKKNRHADLMYRIEKMGI